MRILMRHSFQFMVLALAVSLPSAQAQQPNQAGRPNVSFGIATKNPVFAGACKACPWANWLR